MAPSSAEPPLQIRRLARGDLTAVQGLFTAENWRSYAADEGRTWAALNAPGSLALVAHRDGGVVGIAQTLADGHIQAFLTVLLVAATERRAGTGRALIEECLRLTPGVRLDLISLADDFYRALGFQAVSAFRLERARSRSAQ